MAFVYRVNGGLTAAMWLRFGVLLFGCFLGLTIANFANDLFDHVLGVDDQEDSIGGTGVIQAGLITCRQFFFAILFLCAATLAIGVGLIVTLPGSLRPVLLFLAVFAVASAVFYVAPPIRYGHRGLGEVMVGINLGLIVVSASATIIAQSFDIRSLAVALPVVGMVAGILYYQSLPEMTRTRQAGRPRWPISWARITHFSSSVSGGPWSGCPSSTSGSQAWPAGPCCSVSSAFLFTGRLRSLSLPGVTATGWNSTGTGIWCVSAISRAAFPASWELPFDILPRLKPWDS